MMKFKTVVLCLKLFTCLVVQRSFGNYFSMIIDPLSHCTKNEEILNGKLHFLCIVNRYFLIGKNLNSKNYNVCITRKRAYHSLIKLLLLKDGKNDYKLVNKS